MTRARAMTVLLRAALVACALALHARGARAQVSELPDSLVRATLAAHKATAFEPAELDAADYTIEALGPALEGVRLELEPGSVRFVRVADLVVVPRGVVRVRVAQVQAGVHAGVIDYAGALHPLVRQPDGTYEVEVPVALLADRSEPIRVQLRRQDQVIEASYGVRFTPRPALSSLVMLDSSCSPFGVHVERGALPKDAFMHVGCRLVRTARADDMSATFEVYMLFDRADRRVELNGMRVAPVTGSLYVLRLGSRPGHARLRVGEAAFSIVYASPPTLPAAFLGAGVGPYHYLLRDGQRSADTIVPLVTVYGGYTFTPDVRIVYFNATALHRRGYADNGLYLWLEQARMVDDRLSFNLLLGANMLVYSHDDRVEWRMTAPQGFELVYRDVFGKNRSGMIGAFLYPDLFDRSYYNVWLRWGSPQLFGELNYIHWKQPHADGVTSSTSIGVSFGTPIARFF